MSETDILTLGSIICIVVASIFSFCFGFDFGAKAGKVCAERTHNEDDYKNCIIILTEVGIGEVFDSVYPERGE